MIYSPSLLAVAVFMLFVAVTLGLSYFLGSRAKSSQGYFAAHGQIPWFVNGIAFAGDYLSAASFLGICGMIAFYGYDGFLYSIGYLAGWIVALFVVAEPMKRLGKFTFADALDSQFQSPHIKLAAGISTLAVSIFYLIPQMVGAGVLVQPLLGWDHWVGVVLVGAVVIFIVVTAGMVSTTWVQFLKGSLLVIFSLVLTMMILNRGLEVREGGIDGHEFAVLGPLDRSDLAPGSSLRDHPQWVVQASPPGWDSDAWVHLADTTGQQTLVFRLTPSADNAAQVMLYECQTVTTGPDGVKVINGQPQGSREGEHDLHPTGHITALPGGVQQTGPLGPLEFFRTLQQSEVMVWRSATVAATASAATTVYYPQITPGSKILRPGEHPRFQGIRTRKWQDRVNFLSLMLALFCGTASLPHILIRYYTVKDETSARKSTIVGIASIGFFYILTLYMGLGAMTSGALDVTDNNMAAPLLARSMNQLLFAVISAIAFTTVLGTVSGLILASAGAVAHDLPVALWGKELTDHEKVRIAKVASVAVGALAIVLGILFAELNVSYLVGWAFSVAASANLPSLVMLLFWKRVTWQGIVAAVVVGMTSSLAWILLSADTFSKVYGLPETDALVPFSQPGIVTIPLGFLTIWVVSLLTSRPTPARA